MRAEFRTARVLGEQLLRLAQQTHDPVFLLAAPNGLGLTLTHLGELRPARAHLEQSLAFYAPHIHCACTALYGIDLVVDSRAHLAHVLWLLGYPEQAVRHGHAACMLARELGHPFSQAHARNLTAVVHQLCGEGLLAQMRAEVGMRLAHEHGFALEEGRGMILGSWGLLAQGQVAAGVDQMRHGISTYRATAVEVWRPYYATLLAVGYGKTGQHAKGLRVLAEALAVAGNSGEYWWEAELHRLTGEFFLVHNVPKPTGREAEQCFQRALCIARRQQAKSLELRAAMGLARLWRQQSKRQDGYDLLAPVYNWFTEGFDTADLQEAKVLLEELEG